MPESPGSNKDIVAKIDEAIQPVCANCGQVLRDDGPSLYYCNQQCAIQAAERATYPAVLPFTPTPGVMQVIGATWSPYQYRAPEDLFRSATSYMAERYSSVGFRTEAQYRTWLADRNEQIEQMMNDASFQPVRGARASMEIIDEVPSSANALPLFDNVTFTLQPDGRITPSWGVDDD